jgi:predicted nucleic acid-binding protein
MYLLDTNIFLEVLLDQEQADECVMLLELVRDGKERAVVTSFTLHSIEVILCGIKKREVLERFLSGLLRFEGLTIFATTLADETEIVRKMEALRLDFDDCLQYYVAELFGLELVSFDTDFDRTKIGRIEPKDMVKRSW